MTKIDIVAGLLGAGKTTMINRILSECYKNQKVVIIENEYGKAGIDTELINHGFKVKEITSGCVCCTLKLNLIDSIRKIIKDCQPDYIILEPSGVASLRDMIQICKFLSDVELHMVLTIINGKKFYSYQELFGNFFKEQIEYSHLIYINRFNGNQEIVKEIKKWNLYSPIITTSWEKLNTTDFLTLVDEKNISTKPAKMYNKSVSKFNDIQTWTYSFRKPLTENKIYQIFDCLNSNKVGRIIRGKGILCVGKKKILADYVLGDFSCVLIEDFKKSQNEYVVIGQNLKTDRLNEVFLSLDC